MSKIVEQNDWSLGIDNRSNWRTPRDRTVRDAVNLVPNRTGGYSLRPGYAVAYAGADVRGALCVGDTVLIADGTDLVAYDTLTDSSRVLARIAGAGPFTGAVLNDELFFCTANETFRFKSGLLRRWGVSDVTTQPTPVVLEDGQLLAGTYHVAVTYMDAYGDEGGTTSAVQVTVEDGAALLVDVPALAGYTSLLYVSAVNSNTLYLQRTESGQQLVGSVRDDRQRLQTMHHVAPKPGQFVVYHNGTLLVADGRTLWVTTPLRPHIMEPKRGFFQFPVDIGFLVSVGDGVYVSADKTYFLRGVETAEPAQSTVLDYASVRGTAIKLPDGRGAWMSKYGVVIGDGTGQVEEPAKERFVPQLANDGASCILENNGTQSIVTTMSGNRGQNPLAASDYYEAEITL